MWDSKKSLFLSIVLTDLFGIAAAVMCFVLPSFLKWYFGNGERAVLCTKVIISSYYPCVPFVLGALIMLHILLNNMRQNKVFVSQNVIYLRAISWCCFTVAIVTLIGGCFYFPFLVITAIMSLTGLIVRVVKNVFCSAIELKDENDMTI